MPKTSNRTPKAAAALVALLLMAMSCDPYYDLRVSGQNGRVTIDGGPE